VILRAESVGKVFSDGQASVRVLDDVSLSLSRGEIVALEGYSGSGKTTLLSILGCILTPSEGHVRLEGEIVNPARAGLLSRARRRAIGFVFQQFNLFPALTARENVELALEIKGEPRATRFTEAGRLLTLCGLGERPNAMPRDLSGGQKQRLAVARALAGKPSVLLADEPTANLDSVSASMILDLFRDLARAENCGLLIVTHDPRVRERCDRILRLEHGRMVGSQAEAS